MHTRMCAAVPHLFLPSYLIKSVLLSGKSIVFFSVGHFSVPVKCAGKMWDRAHITIAPSHTNIWHICVDDFSSVSAFELNVDSFEVCAAPNSDAKLRLVSLRLIKPTVVSLAYHVRHVFNYRLKSLNTRGLWLATALSGRKVFYRVTEFKTPI